MSDTTYSLLCAFGLTYVIVGSSIFAPVRILLARTSKVLEILVYCAYCVGFWAGAGLHIATHADLAWRQFYDAFECGLLVMGAIALVRAPWPDFLAGAYEAEREVLRPGSSTEDSDD